MSRPDGSGATFVGLHHVRVPVSDLMRSRDWYCDVFGFEARLTLVEEDRDVGVVLHHSCGLTLGLHIEPERALALAGFSPIGLSVGADDDLRGWCARLDALHIEHSGLVQGHLGWYVSVADPDGIVIELHTPVQPSADEA